MSQATEVEENDQMAAYSEAVKSGLYNKNSGLVGKYDNVRRYWEDEITRHFLYPHLHELVCSCRAKRQRIRIMDLGCGSGDGYELLMGIRDKDASLNESEVDLLRREMIDAYVGVDLSCDLLQQGTDVHGANNVITFRQANFCEGLALEAGEAPYDLYFSSYGTWSHHNDDETAIQLLADIARHTREHALIVCDWLGRYSYEWRSLWTNQPKELENMDYVVSYIYPDAEREARRDELQHLCLRLMSQTEVHTLIAEASRRAGCEIKLLDCFDRSVLTGRHMDTCEYNDFAQPIRNAVNSLHESNVRTDLNTLRFQYEPKDGFDEQNRFFQDMERGWNSLVEYAQELLDDFDEEARCFRDHPIQMPDIQSIPLQNMFLRMRKVVEGTGWLKLGLPRENIIEPQLGYALRHLVMETQRGRGCAHGLCGILEVNK